MSDSSDADLLKKRARRRLVGAVAFAGLAAVVLPMVMDDEPKQQVQDVQIRIPGQDQAAFSPKLNRQARSEAVEAPARPAERPPEKPADKAPEKVAEKAPEKMPEKGLEKPADKAPEKTPEKAPEKAAEKKTPESHPEKVAEKPRPAENKVTEKSSDDTQRAAAILSGKNVEASAPAAHGQFVILIGAFSNPGNVKVLQGKLGELGLKVFTEPLETPEGKKTRVRVGPFPNRDAAEKAADKMKRIGVNGVVAAKS